MGKREVVLSHSTTDLEKAGTWQFGDILQGYSGVFSYSRHSVSAISVLVDTLCIYISRGRKSLLSIFWKSWGLTLRLTRCGNSLYYVSLWQRASPCFQSCVLKRGEISPTLDSNKKQFLKSSVWPEHGLIAGSCEFQADALNTRPSIHSHLI